MRTSDKWFYTAMAALLVGFIVLMVIVVPQSIEFNNKCEAAGGGVVRGECVPVIELD